MASHNLSGISPGNSFSLLFRAKTCAGATVDLSGYSIFSTIKEKYSSSTGIASFTSTISVPESGICNISLSPTQTSGLYSQAFVYSVGVENTDTLDSFNLLNGYLFVDPFPAFY